MRRTCTFGLVATGLLLLGLVSGFPAHAASPSEFSATSDAIASAFAAVNRAGVDGGNVTALVGSLNLALGLYNQAQAEATSDPAKASSDLQNATMIAQQVAVAAPGVGQSGLAARQTQEYISLSAAAVIVAVAALLYYYGERIYHKLWLRLYSGYVVRKVG